MSRHLNHVMHLIHTVLIWLLVFFLSFLPRSLVARIGQMWGWIQFPLVGGTRKQLMGAIDSFYLDQIDILEKLLICRTFYRFRAQMDLQAHFYWQVRPHNFLKNVRFGAMGDLYQAREKSRGMIIATAHFGDWRLMALSLRLMNLKVAIPRQQHSNPFIGRATERDLLRSGLVFYDLDTVGERLEQGYLVIMHIDEAVKGAEMVRLNNRSVPWGHLPAATADHRKCALLTAFSLPTGPISISIRFGRLMTPGQHANVAEKLVQELSAIIQQHPSYYQWPHLADH